MSWKTSIVAWETQAEQFSWPSLPTPPAKEEGELLILTADGKGVPLVKKDAQQVPVFEEKNQRPGNRRMATLGCVYTVDRARADAGADCGRPDA